MNSIVKRKLLVLSLTITINCIQHALNLAKKTKRRWWRRPTFQRRLEMSEFENLVPQMATNDPEYFYKYMRMSPERYSHLLSMVADKLQKYSMNKPVTPNERLTITLVFLATGCSQQDLAFRFQRGRSTINNIVRETCTALWDVLSPIYLQIPNEPRDWEYISNKFNDMWNFPNCVGALDGKHFLIQCPTLSGSQFFNYKHQFSSLVLAMCDAEYKFIYVNFGSAGREGDAGVFSRSDLLQCIDNDTLNMPSDKCLPGFDYPLPYVIVADEAFPLKEHIMRPFPGRGRIQLPLKENIYNYRLSRARRCIENAFGILVARWRIFRTPIIGNIDNIEHYIRAGMVLHNYLRVEEGGGDGPQRYVPPGFVDAEMSDGTVIPGAWRNEPSGSGMVSAGRWGANMSAKSITSIRDRFADYFVSPPGSLPWQNKMI